MHFAAVAFLHFFFLNRNLYPYIFVNFDQRGWWMFRFYLSLNILNWIVVILILPVLSAINKILLIMSHNFKSFTENSTDSMKK